MACPLISPIPWKLTKWTVRATTRHSSQRRRMRLPRWRRRSRRTSGRAISRRRRRAVRRCPSERRSARRAEPRNSGADCCWGGHLHSRWGGFCGRATARVDVHTGLRKHRRQHAPTAPRHCCFSLDRVMLFLFLSLRQMSKRNVRGVDRRETGVFAGTRKTSLSGTLVMSWKLTDWAYFWFVLVAVFSLSNKCFSTGSQCSASSASDPPDSWSGFLLARWSGGRPSPRLLVWVGHQLHGGGPPDAPAGSSSGIVLSRSTSSDRTHTRRSPTPVLPVPPQPPQPPPLLKTSPAAAAHSAAKSTSTPSSATGSSAWWTRGRRNGVGPCSGACARSSGCAPGCSTGSTGTLPIAGNAAQHEQHRELCCHPPTWHGWASTSGRCQTSCASARWRSGAWCTNGSTQRDSTLVLASDGSSSSCVTCGWAARSPPSAWKRSTALSSSTPTRTGCSSSCAGWRTSSLSAAEGVANIDEASCRLLSVHQIGWGRRGVKQAQLQGNTREATTFTVAFSMDRGPLDMLVQIVHTGKTYAFLLEQPCPEHTHHVTSENGWASARSLLQLAATVDDVLKPSKEGQARILLWDMAHIHASEATMKREFEKKKVHKDQLLLWKKERPRLCISRLRSNESYSTELFGGTHQKILRMHLAQNWIRERKRQSGGIIQKGEPHERNPCAPSFEKKHLRKPNDKQIVPAK